MDKGKHRSSTRGVCHHREGVCARVCGWHTSTSLVLQNGSGSGQVPETIAPMNVLSWNACPPGERGRAPDPCQRGFSLCDSQFGPRVFVVPSWPGSAWPVSAAQRNVSKWWVLSSIACTAETNRQVLLEGGGAASGLGMFMIEGCFRSRPPGCSGSPANASKTEPTAALLCLSANDKGFKSLCPVVSALLRHLRRQTRAFTVINEGKWSKAVLEWDRQFFSAGKQRSLTLTKSEPSRRKKDGC